MAVTIVSTTDTQEDVNLAAGLTADGKDPAEAEEQGTAEKNEDGAGAAAGSVGTADAGDDPDDHSQAQPGAAAVPGSGENRRKTGYQRKIARLETQLEESQRETLEMRERLARLEGAAGVTKKETGDGAAARTANQPRPKPKPTDAKYKGDSAYEDYIEDLADWKAENKYAEMNKTREQQELTEAQQEMLRENYEEHLGRVDKAKAEIADFDEVTSQRNVQIPAALQPAIIESPISARLVYHLFKNPEDREQLIELCGRSVASGVRFLGRIEAQLEKEIGAQQGAAAVPGNKNSKGKEGSDKGKSKDAGVAAGANGAAAGTAGTANGGSATKVASAAPAPITPVSGGPTRAPKLLSELSGAEYRAARRAGRSH